MSLQILRERTIPLQPVLSHSVHMLAVVEVPRPQQSLEKQGNQVRNGILKKTILQVPRYSIYAAALRPLLAIFFIRHDYGTTSRV